jgi:hypothetical protein
MVLHAGGVDDEMLRKLRQVFEENQEATTDLDVFATRLGSLKTEIL